MTFSGAALEKIEPNILKYNFQVIEQRDDYLKLKSTNFIIIVAHNHLEKSNILWIGKTGNEIQNIEIDNLVLKSFFNLDLRLSLTPVDIFFDNLSSFFQIEAESLFKTGSNKLNELLEFKLQRDRIYTQEILMKQDLINVDKAWGSGKYNEFIKLLDKMDKDKLPTSYSLKYSIALKKIKHN